MLENESVRKIKKIDLILITITTICITFIFSAFYIFPNKFFLTRYVQIFLDYLTSILAGNDPIVYDSFGKFFPFLKGFLISVYHLTGLEVSKIIILPFGFLLFPISVYYFIKTLSKDFNMISLFGFLYLLIYSLSSKTLQVAYVSSISIPVIFIVAAQFIKIMRNENIKRNIILVIIELVYLVGVWHSAAFYGLILLFSISIIYTLAILGRVIYKKMKKQQIQTHSFLKPLIGLHLILSIIITSFIVFMGKDSFFSGYLDQLFGGFSDNSFIENLVGFLQPMINRLLGRSDLPLDASKYEFNYTSLIAGKIYSISNILIHLIAGFLFLIFLIYLTIRLFKNKEQQLLIWLVFGYGISLAQIAYYFLYSASGANFFYIAFIFPIIGSFYAIKINKRKIAAFSIISIFSFGAVTAVTSIVSNEFGYYPASVYEDNVYAFNWIHSNIPENSNILLDFNMKDKFIQFNIENCDIYSYKLSYINSIGYQYIVNEFPAIQKYNNTVYLVLDRITLASRPCFDIYEKRGYLISELDMINLNPYLSQVYNDYYVVIYNFI